MNFNNGTGNTDYMNTLYTRAIWLSQFKGGSDLAHIRKSELDAQSEMNTDGTVTGTPANKWGFQGFVITDYDQGNSPDDDVAVNRMVRAGVSQYML